MVTLGEESYILGPSVLFPYWKLKVRNISDLSELFQIWEVYDRMFSEWLAVREQWAKYL